jgi:hypothetical protein
MTAAAIPIFMGMTNTNKTDGVCPIFVGQARTKQTLKKRFTKQALSADEI